MAVILIVKTDGTRLKYDPNRIRATLKRIRAKNEVVDHIVQNVTKQVHDGMTTMALFDLIRRELRKEDHCLSHRYNLRVGLQKLGPAGFLFEKYIAAVMRAYDYDAKLPEQDLRGQCVDHEVDVVAHKQGRCVMIEAKFRNRFEDTVTLKDVLATWARFLDLAEGNRTGHCPKFDEVWIVTNGRFSDRARQFGVCKDIRLVGWGPDEQSLTRLIDHAVVYPITVLDDLRKWELEKLFHREILLCKDLAARKPGAIAKLLGVSLVRAEKIVWDAGEVVGEVG
ncbi:hypothetical protein A3C96_02680 [Candidatus Uhrbacteria bacterium RIFCSPHIGHO2_02_FULL_60_10]|uniref:ATP-cone domain-containing protein n=1 Tax=Candidatus Uhrbacteria bacterium RIFCSPHIGHO2_02_FULL_60_10 TaxID=1802392 RepID=A0A1F7U880_9BACT|nr:MAG: hypothetical protein A3C96_02680 [Candidatus Uhrbacteria bacterium RIFCSPHIGHO2_02_FULL_60_10]